MPPGPGENATDAQIQHYLLNNVRHPSQLRPFLLHYQSSLHPSDITPKPNEPSQAGPVVVKKRAQVASSVLPHTVIVAQDVPGMLS